MKMQIDFVYRNTMSLKKNHPAKFKKLVEQFLDMSTGGDGGPYFGSGTTISVREQYYRDWRDEEFKILLEKINEKNGE